tara:strand:- start:5916 stop:9062 length:3147 start_codon:yes stop_codon:yes gene_type:complete
MTKFKCDEKYVNSSTKKSSVLDIMNGKVFTTMKLVDARKEPTNEYLRDKKTKRYINKCQWQSKTLSQLFENQMKENRAILTGKINNVIVVDLDLYKVNKEDSKFIKDFGEDYIKRFNTLTFKTGNGGEHLLFNYTPTIKTSANDTHHIDIRSDGAYIVAPGSVIDRSHYNKEIKKNKRGYYTIANDTDIKDIPAELEVWLSMNLSRSKKIKSKKLRKNSKNEPTSIEPYEQDEIDLTEYSYTWTDEILIKILNGLPDEYFTDNVSWYVFTTAMKTLGKKELWDKYSQEKGGDKYNKEENETRFWDNAQHKTYMCLENMLDNSSFVDDAKVFLAYFKLKMTDNHNIKPDVVMNERYIDVNNDGNFMDTVCDRRFNLVKADTGCGKTTAFKNYIKKTNKRFISIVSRVSLGKDQWKTWTDAGIECHWHEDVEDEWYRIEGENIVVTIDSVMKMGHWDSFDDYVIYLDEYNSLIEYFVDCPNLCSKRTVVWKYMNKIVEQGDKIIMTDADISDDSFKYIASMGESYEIKYIDNKYLNNQDNEATELFSYESLIETISQQDKAMICLDSKNCGEKLCSDMKEKYDIDIKYYSSDTTEHIDLDAHKFVAFSPKVVYGLDSLMERPVFCYYKCQTISPVAMVQQINRNRNITHLYYLFESKSWKAYKYDTIQDVKDEITDGTKLVKEHFEILCDAEECELYNDLLASFRYTLDCYNTNKFAWWEYLIQKRGFKITNFMDFNSQSVQKSGGFLTKLRGEMLTKKGIEILEHWDKVVDEYNLFEKCSLMEKENNYMKIIRELDCGKEPEIDFDKYDIDELKQGYQWTGFGFNGMPEYHNWIWYREQFYQQFVTDSHKDEMKVTRNKILSELPESYHKLITLFEMPFDKIGMEKYNILLRDPVAVEKHFHLSNYLRKDNPTHINDMMEQNDFNSQKYKSSSSKYICLNKMIEAVGLKTNEDTNEITMTKLMDEKQAEKLQKEYCLTFRNRSKKLNFNEPQQIKQKICQIQKQLFGNDYIDTQQTSKMVNGKTKKVTKYFINQEQIELCREVNSWKWE